jgi:replicative DNA helicase Mcm
MYTHITESDGRMFPDQSRFGLYSRDKDYHGTWHTHNNNNNTTPQQHNNTTTPQHHNNTTTTQHHNNTMDDMRQQELEEKILGFFRTYCDEDIAALARQYPKDAQTLCVEHDDLHQYDPGLVDDWLDNPVVTGRVFESALDMFDLPIDIDLTGANVALAGLPPTATYYPGGFSPTDRSGQYLSIEGEVAKASDVYSRITTASFQCQRCECLSKVPQSDNADILDEPHECQSCERQGPFKINFDQSDFIDAQLIRLKTPPEEASGAGRTVDVYLEDTLVDQATVGDRVIASGQLRLEQMASGRDATGKFEPWLDASHIGLEDVDDADLEIPPEHRERIHSIAEGVKGDPIDVAAQTLAPSIHGNDAIKQAMVLALISGGDSSRRKTMNILVLGDPSTGKSRMVKRATEIGWRTVPVSSKRATGPGLTVTAKQDDFGDGDWSLKAGAFVQANGGGTVLIDELDDMEPNARAAMLEPMSTQTVDAMIAGEKASFTTKTATIAAGNPEHGRFDKYEPITEQFDFSSALLSRMDLIFTIKDNVDTDEDEQVASHILDSWDDREDNIPTPVDDSLFREWLALANQHDEPEFASETVKEGLAERYLELRQMGKDDDGPVPVTHRSLEATIRIAEAVAKLELSDEITMDHAKTATRLVGESMDDIGKNEDGERDADIIETGQSKTQRERKKDLKGLIKELQEEHDNGVPIESIIEEAEEIGITAESAHGELKSFKQNGNAYEPENNHIRWVGDY